MIIRGSDKNLLSAAILFQYVPRVLRICLSWRKIIRTDNQLSRFTLVKFVLYFFLYIIASHVSWMFNFLVYPSTKMFGMLVWLRSSNLSRLNKALCRSRGMAMQNFFSISISHSPNNLLLVFLSFLQKDYSWYATLSLHIIVYLRKLQMGLIFFFYMKVQNTLSLIILSK